MFSHPVPWRPLAAMALLVLLTSLASAQNRNPSGMPSPQLFQVFPPGARAGSSVEIVVAGRHLEEPEKLVFSHPGVRAELVAAPKEEIDPKTKKPKAGMPAVPPAENIQKFKVTVPPEVPPSLLDVRLVNKWGVSNPRAFAVGDLPEVLEKEPNNDVEQAQRIELNSTVNGTIATGTDVDYFIVAARKGQRVVVSCLAGSIDSRLQPSLEVYDSKDRLLNSNRLYNANADAVTDFTAPEDGDYLIRLYQFTFTLRTAIPGGMPAGSSDNSYRLNVTTAPWIDAVVPSVVEPGKTATVTVYGRNLPGGKVETTAGGLEKANATVTAPAADGLGKLPFSGSLGPASGWVDGFEFRLRNTAGVSNPFLIGLARAPVVLDQTDNDTPEKAQEIPVPCEVAGQVEKRRDRDWFRFTAKQGETFDLEVVSNRLGAPTYMMFVLYNPASKSEMYESPLNENTQSLCRRFFTRSEDPPPYRFTAPADGSYLVLVASRAGDTLFGPRHTYALRISKSQPDFRLIALSGEIDVPDAPKLPAGGQQAFTVLADRSEGFHGDIELSVEGLPAGVSCPPQILHGRMRQTTLVVSAAADAAPWTGEIRIKGTAVINGNKLTREARPAGILWPIPPNQNSPTVSRLERSLWLAVRGKAPLTLTPALTPTELKQGEKGKLVVKVNRILPDIKNPIQVNLMAEPNQPNSELPNNLRINNNQPINIAANQNEGTLEVVVGNDVPPGVYNVVLRGQTQVPYAKDPMSKNKPNTFVVAPSLPVQLSVLPRELAKFQLANTNPTLKIGGQVEVVVRVQRLFDYAGEFRVQLMPGTPGLEAAEVVIPAGATEAKLVLRSPAGAAPGNRANLIVRATAQFAGKPIVHEAKINVNIVK